MHGCGKTFKKRADRTSTQPGTKYVGERRAKEKTLYPGRSSYWCFAHLAFRMVGSNRVNETCGAASWQRVCRSWSRPYRKYCRLYLQLKSPDIWLAFCGMGKKRSVSVRDLRRTSTSCP